MNIKKFSLATLCILSLGLLVSLIDQVSLAQDQPEVYLNDSPNYIIGSGKTLEVPIFFITDVLVDKDLEFYYWREVHEDNSTEYLNSECNWVTFSDSVEIQPLCQGKLPAYLYFKWIDPPRKEQEPQKYTLHVCIDSILDELYPDEFQEEITYACAAQKVNLDYCIPENILLDGQVNPAKISDSVLEGVQPPSHVLTIRDDCNDTISCRVTYIPYFVDKPVENGTLDGEILVQFKNNQSIWTYKDNIVLECPLGGESITKEIPVELVVTPSSGSCESEIFFQITDSFPFQVARDGGKILLSVRAGEEKSISLTCGKTEPLSDFEANVSGSGCFRVEKDISPGKYSKVKIIPVSSTNCSGSLTVSSGGKSARVSVDLTFQGSITPSSLSISPSDINETLPSGDSCKKTIYVTCSGTPASSFFVSDPGKSWLSVGSSTSYSFTLTLNTNGLSEGDTRSADLEISSSSCGSGTLSKTLRVSLTVDGVCTPTTAELSRNPISLSVTKGSNAASQNVRIEDNCGNPLDFEIAAVSGNWIKSPKAGNTGNGALSVDFDTTSLLAKTYNGSIDISTALGNLTLNINLTVSSDGGGGGGGASAITLERDTDSIDFKAEEVKLFKFRADSGPSKPTLTVKTVVQSCYSHGDLHMMVKYAGQDWQTDPPTGSDYSNIQEIIEADPYRFKGVYNGIYYFMSGHLAKRLSINYPQQVTGGCWYVWVKNIGGIRLDDCIVRFF